MLSGIMFELVVFVHVYEIKHGKALHRLSGYGTTQPSSQGGVQI